MRRLATIVCRKTCALLLLAVFPLTGLAHTLEAPETVQADADGSFSYEWVFTVGPGSAFLAAAGWDGLENVPWGEVGDCFCFPDLCLLSEGEIITWDVVGALVDSTQSGFIDNWVALCDEPGLNTLTTILPPTTPVDDVAGLGGKVVPLSNRPNPFAGHTTFTYALPESGPVTLEIYDVAGRLVATALNQMQSAGSHSVSWDATRGDEGPARPGVYFARLDVNGLVSVRRVVVAN